LASFSIQVIQAITVISDSESHLSVTVAVFTSMLRLRYSVAKTSGSAHFPQQTIPLYNPPPSLRKSFEPTRLLRQVRHRFRLDSAFAFVLIHP
jgi:hypothetical protein